MGGNNEAIKAKELKDRQQVALTVSPAEATTSVVGSLTSGSDHISPARAVITSAPVGNGCTSAHEEVFAPVLAVGVKARPSRTPPPSHGVRRLVQPPSAAGGAGEAVDVADPRTAPPSPVRWTASHAPPQRQDAAPEAVPEPPRPRSQAHGS
jgi:hypothetical protein